MDALAERLARLRAATADIEQMDARSREHIIELSRSLAEECQRASIRCCTKTFLLEEVGDERTRGYLEVSEQGLYIAFRSTSEDQDDFYNDIPQEYWTYRFTRAERLVSTMAKIDHCRGKIV